VLREELNCPDGLASPDVYILDPCCGTGAYLVAAIEKIAATLASKSQGSSLGALGGMAETGQNLKDIVLSRVFGFELLTAPFVIAHLQVGLLLQRYGQELELYGDDRDRVGIFLTNALTGWREGDPLPIPGFPALERERDAAEAIKKSTPILVVLGNPPYNSFAGMAIDEERELSDAYRTTERAPKPQGQGLNDLYVRFFRMAERKIIEQTQRGVVCFISNYSWLDGLSFTGMRERYLKSFDRIWIDNLNGDKYATGKVTPDGKPDPSIFSTEWNKEGIQVGTAIALLLKQEHSQQKQAKLAYRDFWGKSKLQDLISSVKPSKAHSYQTPKPNLNLGLSLRLKSVNYEYFYWPSLPELFGEFFPGVQTKRDEFLVDIDRIILEERLLKYFDCDISDEEIDSRYPRVFTKTNRFNPKDTRRQLIKRGFLPNQIVPFIYRPFDIRWVYWEPETRLLGEKVPKYFPQVHANNIWFISQQRPRRSWSRPQFTKQLGCLDLMDRGASLFPLLFKPEKKLDIWNNDPRKVSEGLVLNITDRTTKYLGEDLSIDSAQYLFFHVFSILYSVNFSQDNAGALQQDWPRIPLPSDRELLQSSAELGKRIAALLDPETPVETITNGIVVAPYSQIAVPATTHGQNFHGRDFSLTANWGNGGNGKPVMPGKGKAVQRDYTDRERQQMGAAAIQLLGATTYDVYLNETAYWQNIPERVWKYTIGGYQVIKKWLSYRAEKVLKRPMKHAEVQEVVNMARRISAIMMMETDLDANYQAVKANLYDWSSLR
jgi:predicted helicase